MWRAGLRWAAPVRCESCGEFGLIDCRMENVLVLFQFDAHYLVFELRILQVEPCGV
jgi:hypothetical protein